MQCYLTHSGARMWGAWLGSENADSFPPKLQPSPAPEKVTAALSHPSHPLRGFGEHG